MRDEKKSPVQGSRTQVAASRRANGMRTTSFWAGMHPTGAVKRGMGKLESVSLINLVLVLSATTVTGHR